MAITTIQEPEVIHINREAAWYSIESSRSGESGFYYSYDILDKDDVVYRGRGAKISELDNTIFDANDAFKRFDTPTFQPSITGWAPVENILKQYRAKAYEDGVDTPGFYNFTKKNVLNAWDVAAINTIGVGWTDFLTKMPTSHKVTNTDNFTLRSFNGQLWNTNVNILLNQIKMRYLRLDGYQFEGLLLANPYSLDRDSLGSTTLKNVDNNIVDIGMGPGNLEDTYIHVQKIITPEGTEFPSNSWVKLNFYDPCIGNNQSDILSYTMTVIGSSYNNHVSATHSFELVSSTNGIQLAWLNSYGGMDYFLFDKPNTETFLLDKKMYRKGKWDMNTSGEVSTTSTSRGDSIYNTEVTRRWNVKSDWLSKEEVDGLEDLWVSPNVYARIDGEWYPVVNLVTKQVIHSKQTIGLVRYAFNIDISNKIII